MRNQALVSIYTQVYNTKSYLEKCILSVLNQTFPNFEYILIDNGCTDGCKEILEHYAAQDNRIRLIRYEKILLLRFGLKWQKKRVQENTLQI